MTTLQTLYQALHDLDTDPQHLLETSCYDLTHNNELGFDSKNVADFHVGIPYNSPWPNPGKLPAQVDSTLKAAFIDVLEHGVTAVKKLIDARTDSTLASDKKVFIDITDLDELSEDFFLRVDKKIEPDNVNNLANRIGKLIDAIPLDHTPIIRLLIGSNKVKERSEIDKNVQEIFWPNHNCVVKHPNAQLCVGYYSPNFAAKLNDIEGSKDDLENLAALVRAMVDAMKATPTFTMLTKEQKKSVEDSMDMFKQGEVVTQLTKNVIPAISWNHAKILAVHGQTLLTGGGNYQTEYTDGARDISDLQCKIKGNAAVSAHRYCDHLWKYLSGKHNPDNRSWRHSAPLKGSTPSWNDNAVPAFERAHRKETGGKSVLAVAKLGDWVGEAEGIQYPIQAIDALRDVALSLIFHLIGVGVAAQAPNPFWATAAFAFVTAAVKDDKLTAPFRTAKVTPAAWASRITRCKAISEAKEKVFIDAVSIGGFLQKTDKTWNDKVEKLNTEQLKLPPKDHWDGILWPYDLIAAMANFILRVDITDPHKNNGLYIILSASEVGSHNNFTDLSSISALKDRIKLLADVKHDTFSREGLDSMESWFNARCHIKRISKDGTMHNHNKVYCVDEKLLYIGSDNPYPNYNEEYGVWIDDKDTIDAWIKGNWEPRWSNWAKDP